MILQSLLGVVQGPESRADTNDEHTGSALLEVIRLLPEMAPKERAALVELLKVLG